MRLRNKGERGVGRSDRRDVEKKDDLKVTAKDEGEEEDWMKDKENKRKWDKQGDGSEKTLREQETTIEGPGRGEVTEKVFQEESPRAQSTLYLLARCAALLPPSILQSNTQSVRMHQLKLSHRGTLNQSACRHHVLLCPAFLTALYFFFTPKNSNCSLLSNT